MIYHFAFNAIGHVPDLEADFDAGALPGLQADAVLYECLEAGAGGGEAILAGIEELEEIEAASFDAVVDFAWLALLVSSTRTLAILAPVASMTSPVNLAR